MTTGSESNGNNGWCNTYKGYRNGQLVYEDRTFKRQLREAPYDVVSAGPSRGYVKLACGCRLVWRNRAVDVEERPGGCRK